MGNAREVARLLHRRCVLRETGEPSMLKNHVCLVLDQSGSMHPIRQETVKAFNGIVDEIRKQAKDKGQETTVSVVVFNNHASLLFKDQPPEKAYLTNYNPSGNTALFDGVGLAIETLQAKPVLGNWYSGPHVPRRVQVEKDDSFLVLVVTDGVENNSSRWTSQRLVEEFKKLQNTDRWTFAFNLPPGCGQQFSRQFGIPTDNIREWENTVQGTQETAEKTGEAIGQYFQARSTGQTSVKSFYKMTTDLSTISSHDLKSQLTDVSKGFKGYKVEKEAEIEPFVKTVTGKDYVKGSTFYQLMKPEKVLVDRRVLIQEKGQKTVWGGQEARDLIGLPKDQPAKVVPGNHSNYDIFVESRSVNRKLPRGTRVLVEKV